MIKIAITGGIASGKSTLCQIITERKYPLIDCDALVHEGYRRGGPIYKAVLQAFGEGILDPVGEVDRKKLGALVFENAKVLAKLNEITHPIVAQLVSEALLSYEALGFSLAFVDVPLLFEGGLESAYDASILVATNEDLQLQRLMKRNGYTREEAERRINAQMPLAQKRQKATFVIENNADLASFTENAAALIKKIEDRYISS